MKAEDRAWLRGYACCLATAVRLEGCWGKQQEELLAAVGIGNLRDAGIEEHDAEVIFDPDWSRNKSALPPAATDCGNGKDVVAARKEKD
jgi:hypothetical protein